MVPGILEYLGGLRPRTQQVTVCITRLLCRFFGFYMCSSASYIPWCRLDDAFGFRFFNVETFHGLSDILQIFPALRAYFMFCYTQKYFEGETHNNTTDVCMYWVM